MVYVFTGEGKGKTSAAMWTAVRAALSGMKVGVVCWYKEARWPTADAQIEKVIPGIKVYLSGKGFYKLPTDHASAAEHRQAAMAGVKKAKSLMGKVEVLVLDEVINGVREGLVMREELEELLEGRGATHLILTGRGATKELIAKADLVSEMKKIKHPFDMGVMAVKGLDY